MIRRLLHLLGHFPVVVLKGLARGSWWSVYPHSAYWRLGGNDADVEAVLRRHAALPGLVCWDIGAHQGIYSIGLARAVGPSGWVEAFEPDPVSLGRLRWHRRLNRVSNLRIHPVAVSDHSGEARLYQYHGFGSTTSHLPYPGETLDQVPFRPITLIRLDDWSGEGRLRPPGFIKIDVEGHAVAALDGMRETLRRHHPVMLLAIHSREEIDGARAILEPLGYTLEPTSPATGERLARDFFGELVCLPPDVR